MKLSEAIYSEAIDRNFSASHRVSTGTIMVLYHKAQRLEEKLAEYENDETARRRADAFKIRQLKQYAQHRIGCDGMPCDCGLFEAIA